MLIVTSLSLIAYNHITRIWPCRYAIVLSSFIPTYDYLNTEEAVYACRYKNVK